MTTRARKSPRLTPLEALRLTNEAADQSVQALELARAEVAKIPPAPVPDPRDDVNFERLAEAASTWAQRLNPLRNRWPELKRIDWRLAELDREQQRTSERLAALHERRQRAPREHEAALANWIGDGSKGTRPEAATVALDREIDDVQAELAAFDQLRGRVLGERVAYVEKHRTRLVPAADKETAAACGTYLSLVDQLEVARQELIALRATAVWAACFPSEALVEQPDTHHLCGGLRRPVEAALPGHKQVIPAPAMLELLRSDARHLSSIATTKQAAEMQSVTTGQLTGRVAEWENSAEDNERIATEKREAVARYRREWGHNPA